MGSMNNHTFGTLHYSVGVITHRGKTKLLLGIRTLELGIHTTYIQGPRQEDALVLFVSIGTEKHSSFRGQLRRNSMQMN